MIKGALPCPFCGEEEDLNFGHGTKDREGTPTWVYCGTCGAQGPWTYCSKEGDRTFLVVERGWNKRVILATKVGGAEYENQD